MTENKSSKFDSLSQKLVIRITDALEDLEKEVAALTEQGLLSKEIEEKFNIRDHSNFVGQVAAGATEGRRAFYLESQELVVPVNEAYLIWDWVENLLFPAVDFLRHRYAQYNNVVDGITNCERNIKSYKAILAARKTLESQNRSSLKHINRRIEQEQARLESYEILEGKANSPIALEYVNAESALQTGIEKYGGAAPSEYGWKRYLWIAFGLFAADGIINILIFRLLIGLEWELSISLSAGVALAFSVAAHFMGRWLKLGEQLDEGNETDANREEEKSTKSDNEENILNRDRNEYMLYRATSRLFRNRKKKTKTSINKKARKFFGIFFTTYLIALATSFLLLPRADFFFMGDAGGTAQEDEVLQAVAAEKSTFIDAVDLPTKIGIFLFTATFAIVFGAVLNSKKHHSGAPNRDRLQARFEAAEEELESARSASSRKLEEFERRLEELAEGFSEVSVELTAFETQLSIFKERSDDYSLKEEVQRVSRALEETCERWRIGYLHSLRHQHAGIEIKFRNHCCPKRFSVIAFLQGLQGPCAPDGGILS